MGKMTYGLTRETKLPPMTHLWSLAAITRSLGVFDMNPKNYTKTKWDETEARSGGGVAITRNGEIFCHVTGGINYGVDQARVMIARFNEHPLKLNSINFDKKAIGRKVWWRSEPAIVTSYIHGQACVILEPDGIAQFTVPPEFAKEDPDYYEDGDVKAEILSPHIWWFRD